MPTDESDLLRLALLLLAHLPPGQCLPAHALAASANVDRHCATLLCKLLCDAGVIYSKPMVGTALVLPREQVTLRRVAEAVLDLPLPLRLRFSSAEGRIDAALARASEAYLAALAKVTLADVCGVLSARADASDDEDDTAAA